MNLRRQFDLLPKDQEFLEEYGRPWETLVDGSQWVLVHDFETHKGYNHERVTAAVRIETGYPLAGLDMVYFFPALARLDGRLINNAGATQQIGGKTYQRWSRHRTEQNPWRPDLDDLGTHVLLIEDWLQREFER